MTTTELTGITESCRADGFPASVMAEITAAGSARHIATQINVAIIRGQFSDYEAARQALGAAISAATVKSPNLFQPAESGIPHIFP